MAETAPLVLVMETLVVPFSEPVALGSVTVTSPSFDISRLPPAESAPEFATDSVVPEPPFPRLLVKVKLLVAETLPPVDDAKLGVTIIMSVLLTVPVPARETLIGLVKFREPPGSVIGPSITIGPVLAIGRV